MIIQQPSAFFPEQSLLFPNPQLLAHKLDIVVWTTAEVPDLDPTVLKHLTKVDPQSWSAVTLRCPDADLVIINETHVEGRQNNSLMHEVAHIILKHPPPNAS